MPEAVVPWGAWYETGSRTLSFPERFSLFSAEAPQARGLSPDAIREALESPIASPRLGEISRGRKSAAVAVDDLTRPTPAGSLLPWVLDTLEAEGIAPDKVTVIVATGAHRPLQRQDLLKKLGPQVVDRVAVLNHSPHGGLVELGETRRGTPIALNRWFAEAEVKITLSAVLPHPTAGFSGGAKMVMPGLASLGALEHNHGPAIKEVAGRVGQIEGNALRADIEEAVGRVGVDFAVNAVCPASGVIGALSAGHPIKSHRQACTEARRLFTIQAPSGPADVACLNAYPKDTEFLQVVNAFNVWADRSMDVVAPGGTVVVLTAASEGFGTHGLLGPGGRLYRPLAERAGFASLFRGRAFAVLCPTITRRELEMVFPPSTELFSQWGPCLDFLEGRHPDEARVSVFAASAQQILAPGEEGS